MSGSAAAIAPDPAPPNLDDIYEAAAREWNIDSNLLRSVAGVESSGNVNTPDSHPSGGRPGAQGLMQLWPPTSKSLGVTDPYDPPQAIFGAAKLLSQNLDRYGNVEDALRAYNGGTDPAKWSNPETAAYPGKVAAIYGTLTGSQGGNAPAPKPYQVASADTGTMSDVAPPPDAPPRASPAAGMDLAPHSAPGAPVDVTALPPADFFKLTTGGSAPAAANSNTPAAPPDVTAMSPADFFKATTAPAGIAPAKPSGDPYADQTDDLSMIGRGAAAEASHLASRVYSGANWVDQHAPWLGALDKAAGLDPGAAAATTNAYTGQNDQTYGGSGFYQGGKVGADLAAGLPLGEGIGLAGRGLAYASKSIPSVAGRIVQAGGNLLSGKTGATTLLGKTASSAGTNALQGGIIAGAYGDSPVQGAAWGAALGPAGEILAPAVGKVAGKIFDGGSGLVDRGLTALGAPPRPAALPAEPPPTITQRWANMPAPPSAEPIPAGATAAPPQPAAPAFKAAPPAEYTTTAPAPAAPAFDNKLAPASAPENKLQGAADIPAPADVAPPSPATATPPASDGIPFVMTSNMRANLHDMGYSADDIASLTPGQADEILTGKASAPDAPAPPRTAPSPATASPPPTSPSAAPAAPPVRKLSKNETSQFMQPDTVDDAKYILPNGKLLGGGDEDHDYIAGTLGYGINGQDSVDAMIADTGAIRVNAARALFGQGTAVQIARAPTPAQTRQLAAYLKANGGADVEYNGDFRTVANGAELSRFIKEAGPIAEPAAAPVPASVEAAPPPPVAPVAPPAAESPPAAALPPAAPAAPAPLDLGGGRLAPRFDANRLSAAPVGDRAAPSFSPNRLLAAVPTERADPVIGAPGVAPEPVLTPEDHATTHAFLNPEPLQPLQPQSMGAAASSRDASNPIPEMTPDEAKAQRATYEQWRLTQPAKAGRDTTAYLAGVPVTEAEIAGDPDISRAQEANRQKNPGPYKEVDDKANEMMVDAFRDQARTPTITQTLDAAREARWTANKAAAFANKGKANPERTAGVIDGIADGPDGVDPIVRSKMKQLRDAIQTADGELQTDPERLAGAYHMINRMLSKEGLRADPTSGMVKSQLMEVKAALAQDITDAAPGFRTMLQDYATDSRPIDTQEFLQPYLRDLVTSGGNMTFAKFNRMMWDLQEARAAGGANPAQSIDDATMENLWNIWDHLKRRDTNLALGKAKGSDTNQISYYGAKLGMGGLHVLAMAKAGPLGNWAIEGGKNFLNQKRINKLTTRYTSAQTETSPDAP